MEARMLSFTAIRDVLQRSRSIAIVGAKDKAGQPVDRVGRYLLDKGYTIFPVHPVRKTVWGLTAYPDLASLPQPVDIIDLFRAPQYCPAHAQEVLEYLAPKYNLYILSNGFQELQCHKMRSAGIDHYFKKVVLSDDIGVLKPWPEIFHFAMSATQSELRESLMVGDSWENDITGAQGVGMHQVFYNVTGRTEFPFKPTYQITDLKELLQLL